MRLFRFELRKPIVLALAILVMASLANAQSNDGDEGKSPTPPGLFISPTALSHTVQQPLNPGLANYPNFVAGEAVKVVVSPDGKTLAILTAGMNSLYDSTGNVDTTASTQFLFLYDISGANKKNPALKQVIQQLKAHVGLVWAPNSQALYASGGCDDAVYVYSSSGGSLALSNKISLGHAPNGCVSNAANRTGLGLGVEPNVAGLAISADGKTLVAVNNYNDSISVIDTATGTIRYEYDLRPFATSGAAAGTKGGTFPYSVVLNGSIAYVGADRDREVVAVNVSNPNSGSLVARIQLDGNPNGMTLSADGSTLYVAQDNQDQVAVIDTASNTITHKIDTRGPAFLGFPA
jgi:YVTN family beta-propeller protein